MDYALLVIHQSRQTNWINAFILFSIYTHYQYIKSNKSNVLSEYVKAKYFFKT